MSSEQQQIEQLKEHIKSLEEKFQQLKDQVDKATSKRKEEFYQRHLEKLLNGRHSKNNHGCSDVENEESIHEIKGWKDYKMVVGQLKAYSFKQAKQKRLVAAFYGDASEQYKQKAVEFINSEQIDVIELIDLPDGGISIKPLGLICSNTNNDGIYNQSLTHSTEQDDKNITDFVQHLTRDTKRILKRNEVKDVYKKLYAEVCTKEISSKIDAEILKQFKTEFRKSRHFGELYRGWLGLRFKTIEELEKI